MPQFYTLPTAIGEAKIANAIALGGTIEITKLAIGDGGGTLPTPDSDRTSLVNEIRRAAINTSVVDDDNPNWIVVEQVLPPDVGGWTIREVGLYDADGDLIAYGNYPETYKPVLSEGSGRTQTIRFVMQVSDTAAVTLKVDPSVVLATRQLVDDKVAEHAQSRNHPDATTTAKGFMQYGTSEETRQGTRTDRAAHLAGVKAAIDDRVADQDTVDTGTNDTKFVTPKKLKQWATNWVKQATETVSGMLKVATKAQVEAGEDDQTAVTPKKLRWGVSYSFGINGYLALPGWLGSFIFQWGKKSEDYSSGEVSFLIDFPSECFQVHVTDASSAATLSNIIMLGISGITNSNFTFHAMTANGTPTGPGQFYFFAIGK
ncbi:phage tail protein [Chromohalobacter canadensis]|uniref:phage tail protein n=1 Tax=Chromohalobacter canadensis TaxID=141389 RepID=UPI0021C047FD|nr:phage tail protein [Chromohalobacter canadensis]MCT8467011.1 phage tail protein [Chromohalobacter canadensis]